ncbi:sulfotransferase ssu-1-like [Rhipicephalus sanguineus]|uniref:sulfotransferase ssu-1-like n=1 Tax=Rhipicephalus sanguineus TaxID=34632 RepID=UPI001893E31C|nr:sulfotransferase ssu-1-like [Rhipicephalus sanguineus]
MDEESCRFVEGVWMHNFFRDDAIRSAINYKPREGDIIVVTYPKCGTNWMVFIVYSILMRGKQPSDTVEYYRMCPFIDVIGTALAEHPSRTGPIFTHLPMSVFPPMGNAKYVYVARNPYDCAVSFYHFLKGYTPKSFADVSFERFLTLFLSGKTITSHFFCGAQVTYGDYFDHLLPWYERRNDANVLFLTYEELKADTKGQVLKIADFLGKQYAAPLREDNSVLQDVLNACSVENMKASSKKIRWKRP